MLFLQLPAPLHVIFLQALHPFLKRLTALPLL